jgi:hypothetical protein
MDVFFRSVGSNPTLTALFKRFPVIRAGYEKRMNEAPTGYLQELLRTGDWARV